MIVLVWFAVVIFIFEILVFSFLFSRLARLLSIDRALGIATVSLLATGVAWALPTEGAMGAGVNLHWFELWGALPAIGAWAVIALPAAGLFMPKPVS